MILQPVCTEDEIARMVHRFYEKVRADAQLGPIFDAQIAPEQWPVHLRKMVDFWSSLLRGTARYSGTPMPRHAALPGLSATLFQRWLALFVDTTAELGNPDMEQQANELARRIARSLWLGYQTCNFPERLPTDLSVA